MTSFRVNGSSDIDYDIAVQTFHGLGYAVAAGLVLPAAHDAGDAGGCDSGADAIVVRYRVDFVEKSHFRCGLAGADYDGLAAQQREHFARKAG